jgi:hypothetical protein
MKRETTVENMKKDIAEIIDGVRSAGRDVKKAASLIDQVELVVEVYQAQIEYHDLRQRNSPPSKEELDEIRSLIALAREQIEKRADP